MPDQDDVKERLDLAPFESLAQKEQWSHLGSFHRVWNHTNNLDSKSRKAHYEEWHRKAHLEGFDQAKSHTHTAVNALSQDAQAELPKGVEDDLGLDKPLNASQRKNLKDLVDNDFLALRAEIDQFADDMAQQKRSEIRGEWADRGASADDFVRRARDLMKVYQDATDALVIEARAAGVELDVAEFAQYQKGDVSAKVPRLDTAVKDAEREVEADRRRALNTLERARLTAQKKVLMAGVDPQALGILQTIPNARDLMLEAAAERTRQQLTTEATT
jgi:hypothetical protein